MEKNDESAATLHQLLRTVCALDRLQSSPYNVGEYVQWGHTKLSLIVSPTMDLVLALWMAYGSLLLILGGKGFVQAHDVTRWKKIVYWAAIFYVTTSLTATSSTSPPEITDTLTSFLGGSAQSSWASYVNFIIFFVTLSPRNRDKTAP